ncbi:uncharacterized protein LOC106436249 isoform X2 [Brassica napus]|uniref:uncharacterized protein LOC106436249 isoform X2 n=1 Tax=Brassica napus TaxID=3708 RepID=UPI0006AA60D5|nr:uncharacterized protein LOC106436249 isoform X2 [Brassica napus]
MYKCLDHPFFFWFIPTITIAEVLRSSLSSCKLIVFFTETSEVFPRFETIGEIQKKKNNLPQLENFTCTSKSNAQEKWLVLRCLHSCRELEKSGTSLRCIRFCFELAVDDSHNSATFVVLYF